MNEQGITSSALRFRSRRRRFMLLATAALAAVGVALGISFTADTGTSQPTVTAGSTSPLVFPIVNGASIPPEITALEYTPSSAITEGNPGTSTSSVVTTSTAPRWAPVAGAAGSIPSASGTPGTSGYRGPGDLFVVDGRTASAGGANAITVSVYVTNLDQLQATYSSYAWPVRVYCGNGTGTAGPGSTPTVSSWAIANGTSSSPDPCGLTFKASDFYLTNTGGYLSYYLPTAADRYYLVTLDTGGTWYAVNTSGTLSPNFFVTAQAT